MFKTLKFKLVIFFMLMVILTILSVGFFLSFSAPDLPGIWETLSPALIIGVILSVLLSIILSNIVVKPITTLIERTQSFISEEFHHDFNVLARDEIGRLTRMFNQMNHIIRQSLLQISSEKTKIETILENMTDGIIAFNSNQEVIHINHTARRMLSLSDDTAVVFDRLWLPFDINIRMGDFVYLEHYNAEYRDIEADGKNLHLSFIPFTLEGPKIAGIVVILQDVTERLKLENARREFVADVSHELKTPIATIRLYIETLMDDEPKDEATTSHFLKTIDAEAARMNRIVQDLLSLSTFDSSKYKIEMNPFSFSALVHEVVDGFLPAAEKEEKELSYKETTPITGDVYGDREKIKQVLINIISNAVKYSGKDGKIEVFTGEPHIGVYVKVRDNGVGIPERDLPHVFDRFYRVDKARSRETGGTGLGLSIAKELVEMHGGTITIDSVYGEYTEVTISLPKI